MSLEGRIVTGATKVLIVAEALGSMLSCAPIEAIKDKVKTNFSDTMKDVQEEDQKEKDPAYQSNLTLTSFELRERESAATSIRDLTKADMSKLYEAYKRKLQENPDDPGNFYKNRYKFIKSEWGKAQEEKKLTAFEKGIVGDKKIEDLTKEEMKSLYEAYIKIKKMTQDSDSSACKARYKFIRSEWEKEQKQKREKGDVTTVEEQVSGKPIEIKGQADFQKEVLNSKIPVLVVFYNPPNRPLDSILVDLAKKHKEVLKIVKINFTETNNDLFDQFLVMHIPCLMLFNQGKGKVIDEYKDHSALETEILKEINGNESGSKREEEDESAKLGKVVEIKTRQDYSQEMGQETKPMLVSMYQSACTEN